LRRERKCSEKFTNDTGEYSWFMFRKRFHEDDGREIIEIWNYKKSDMLHNSNEDHIIRLVVIDVK